MRKTVFVALSALLPSLIGVQGGPAQAADLGDWRSDRGYRDEPIMVPRYHFAWTGYYLGGNLGYAMGDSSSFGPDSGFSIQPSGLIGGLQTGYNWQNANLLFGLEADIGAIGADDEQSSATAYTSAEYGAYGTLTARLGYADDRWLFYLKGGLALANIENTGMTFAGGVITDLTETDETRAGWTLGGGAEFAFHPNWSMKIEYMYMDFGEETSTGFSGDTFVHDNDLHSIKVGLNYRFQPVMQEPLR